MTNPIDRCFDLARDKGLDVEKGEHEGQPALFHNGKPFAVFVKEQEVDLATTFEGSLQLLQSDLNAFEHPKGMPQGNAVKMDCAKLSDEEIAIHLEQSCHCVG